MKKILSLLGAVGLIATSAATVVSCGSGTYLGTGTDLSAENVNRFLGQLKREPGKDQPTDDNILTAFYNSNKSILAQIKLSDVTITRNESSTDGNSSATITAKTNDGAKFTGFVIVTYTYAEKVNLNDLNIGLQTILLLPNQEDLVKPTDKQILDAFEKVNDGLDVELGSDVIIAESTANSALIKANQNSKIVENEVRVFFKTVKFSVVSEAFATSTTNLGTVEVNVYSKIPLKLEVIRLFVVKSNNIEILWNATDYDNYTVTNITHNSATIKLNGLDKELTLSFKVVNNLKTLSDTEVVINVENVGLTHGAIEKLVENYYVKLDWTQLYMDFNNGYTNPDKTSRSLRIKIAPESDSNYIKEVYIHLTLNKN